MISTSPLTDPHAIVAAALRCERLEGRVQSDPNDPAWPEALMRARAFKAIWQELLPHVHYDQVRALVIELAQTPLAGTSIDPLQEGGLSALNPFIFADRVLLGHLERLLDSVRSNVGHPRYALAQHIAQRAAADPTTAAARKALLMRWSADAGGRRSAFLLWQELTDGLPSADVLEVAQAYLPHDMATGVERQLATQLAADDHGTAVIAAIAQRRFQLASVWFQANPVPLPLATFRAALIEARRGNPFDTRDPDAPFTEALEEARVSRRLATALLAASADVSTIAPILKASRAWDPRTQRPVWQGWLEHGGEIDGGSFDAWQRRHQVVPAILATLLPLPGEPAPDPAPVWATLDRLREHPYLPTTREILVDLAKGLWHHGRPRRDDYADVAQWRIEWEADQQVRSALFEPLLTHLDLSQVPELAQQVLLDVLDHDPEAFDAMVPRLIPYWVPEQESWETNVLEAMLASSESHRLTAPIAAHTPPMIVGGVVLQEMAAGNALRPLLGPPESWCLPVGAYRAYLASQSDAATRVARFDAAMEAALDQPDYHLAVRARLFDACAEVRPHIAEARFVARDRQHHLQASLPSREGRRPRA